MSRASLSKKQRQTCLLDKLNTDPFLTDEELAETFKVSVPTIRLDRLELGIPELRERIKGVAEKSLSKVKSIKKRDIKGEIINIDPGIRGISILETDESMAFQDTEVIQGGFIYSFAESIAIAVIDANVALVGVANIKYKIPVYIGDKLVAKADVKKTKENKHIVWVSILEKQIEVFRGKFILVSLEKI